MIVNCVSDTRVGVPGTVVQKELDEGSQPSAIFPSSPAITILLAVGVAVAFAGSCATFESESSEAMPFACALLAGSWTTLELSSSEAIPPACALLAGSCTTLELSSSVATPDAAAFSEALTWASFVTDPRPT